MATSRKGKPVSKRANRLINKLLGAARKYAWRGSDCEMEPIWTEAFLKAKADMKDFVAELETKLSQLAATNNILANVQRNTK